MCFSVFTEGLTEFGVNLSVSVFHIICNIDFVGILYQLLGAIGEQFEDPDEICGCVINIRNKQDRINIWTKTASNESAQVSCVAKYFRCKDKRTPAPLNRDPPQRKPATSIQCYKVVTCTQGSAWNHTELCQGNNQC